MNSRLPSRRRPLKLVVGNAFAMPAAGSRTALQDRRALRSARLRHHPPSLIIKGVTSPATGAKGLNSIFSLVSLFR